MSASALRVNEKPPRFITSSSFRLRPSSFQTGGEGGIRTHGTVSRSQHFQCCQFNHSCTSPGGISDCEIRVSNLSESLLQGLRNPQFAIRNPKFYGGEGGI